MQKDIGLEPEQVEVLMKCFNGFCNEGVVHADTVGEILQMMGLRVKKEALTAIIAEVDEDGESTTLRRVETRKYNDSLDPHKCVLSGSN